MKTRVVLFDDSDAMRSLLADLFASLDDFVVVGSERTESAATSWLLENPDAWDLAVIDLVLQDGSGFHLISRCARSHPEGRIVALSSYMSPAVAQHCRKLGAHGTYNKANVREFIDFVAAAA